MRKRIYEIIEAGADEDDKLARFYDFFMMVSIVVSIVPLWFHYDTTLFLIIDKVTVIIFIFDYFLRLLTADFKVKKGRMSFLIYPFTPMAIIDLLSILPSLTLVQKGFRMLRILRLLRTLKVLRIFKTFRYAKGVTIIVNVFKRQKDNIIVVLGFAVGYVIVSALVIFNAEPDTFPSMFDAIYWATISLTTVGYGDVYAVSTVGKVITMVSAVLGIAIVALPAGIIVAGYQEELNEYEKNKAEQLAEAKHKKSRKLHKEENPESYEEEKKES